MPRRVRLRAQEVEQAILRLSQERSLPSTENEVAEEAGMKVSEYRGFLYQYSRAQVASLDARLERNRGSGVESGALIKDFAAVNPQSQTNVEEVHSDLAVAVSDLDEQERVVATFYFYEGLTLKEIGKALNHTEGRISQILRNALTKLRKRLKESPVAFGNWQETFN